MEFIPLESEAQLSDIRNDTEYNVIFKHNVNCPISKGVHRKLEAGTGIPGVKGVYLLDLHAHRDLSDAVAADYGVQHESPQILLVRGGQCTYHEWGYDISAEDVAEAAA